MTRIGTFCVRVWSRGVSGFYQRMLVVFCSWVFRADTAAEERCHCPVSDEPQQLPSCFTCHRPKPRRFSCCSFRHFLPPNLQFFCSFHGLVCPGFRPDDVQRSRPLNLCRSCAKNLESSLPNLLFRETNIFVFSPDVIDRAFRDSVNISFCLSHNVNVLQLYWKWLFLWLVQFNSRVFRDGGFSSFSSWSEKLLVTSSCRRKYQSLQCSWYRYR